MRTRQRQQNRRDFPGSENNTKYGEVEFQADYPPKYLVLYQK